VFQLSPESFDLIYHSGATEGINTFFKGLSFQAFKEQKKFCFFFSTVDHACVFNLKESLEAFGHTVEYFGVDSSGNFNKEELIKNMLEKKASGHSLALNFTYVNNETGILWPLSLAEEIKKTTGAFVHVDAVQLVGKIADWKNLKSSLDAYTFSGHKFGSLKGQGFTFIKKHTPIAPLVIGGNQQAGMRAGTENAAAVYSLKLALSEFVEGFDAAELKKAKTFIEDSILRIIGNKGEIIGYKNPNRNLNTIFLLIKGLKADLVSARFDLLGMDVSTGSACSSGVIKENRILMNMGHSEEDSKSAIRLSFSPFMTMNDAEIFSKKIESALLQLLK
jgi:cysteine desulfurase